MNRKFFALIVAIVIASAAIFSGCNGGKDNPEPKAEESLPFLKAGNEWVYKSELADASGEVKYKILSKEKNGFYTVNWFIGVDFEIYWHEKDGAFANTTDGPLGQLRLVIYKKNCKVGDSWSVKGIASDLGANVTITNKVISTSETVTTPAGTFSNCVKVRQTNTYDPELVIDHYIHPATGIVKIEGMGYEEGGEDGEIIYFPVHYTLKSKNF